MRMSLGSSQRNLVLSMIRWASGLLLLALVACPQRRAIWLVPGSTAEALELGLGVKTGHEKAVDFGGLTVWRCDAAYGRNKPLWAIEANTVQPPDTFPTRLRYAHVPTGFRERSPAEPLVPGCYIARTTGTGATKFEVESSGRATTLTADSTDQRAVVQ